jgi:hypothetical protein
MLAMAFNVCRMSFLTMVAAKKGVAAIAQYHDPAGIMITLVCTAGLWGLAVLFLRKQKTESGKQKTEISDQKSEVIGQTSEFRISAFPISTFCFVLLAWLVVVEVGVESWYRVHESRLPKSVSWTMEWPRTNPTFSQLAIGEKATRMLRYDEAVSAEWKEEDGTQWQMIYLRWLPGRIAVDLAKMHTPEACLKAAGGSVQTLPGLMYLPIHGLKLPFREYVLDEQGGSDYVFYCLWEDRANEQFFQTQSLTYGKRLEPVLAGQRNVGQRSLEVVARGFRNVEEAQNALARQLETLLKVNGVDVGSRK